MTWARRTNDAKKANTRSSGQRPANQTILMQYARITRDARGAAPDEVFGDTDAGVSHAFA